eukprot:CAMPEP_0181135000 /NCGR_PEP_ID=MMETSP1071-20121207/32388_1 /TAXON_ID=35127 /ORGANISM="Thalassiosira sp., Strain NH16" /LENGTH=424 /DNA_ID=CAMNT_0023221557 /DNA_START=71 /DNA_END=1345 /DNA_ORIENTATION=-
MSSDSLGTLIHRLSGVYRDPQRVLRDAEFLLSSPLGAHLRPTTEPLMLNDGSSTPPVLLLRGTLPMTYRGVTYNVPIDMYLPPPYPLRPPTVFVRPVVSMAIKENHRHVGLDGRVYLPYLHEWRPATHELRELAVWMSSLFGSEPPVYTKPVSNGDSTNGHHNPPPYSQVTTTSSSAHSHTSPHGSLAYSSTSTAAHATNNSAEEERRKALEKEIAEANIAAQTARIAAAEEARVEAERKRAQREQEETLSSTRVMASSKVQFEIQTLFRGMKEELRLELKNQKQLDYGKEQIEKLTKEGEERKALLQKGNEEMDDLIEGLEKWLEAIKEQQSTAIDASDNEESGMMKADLMALPADTHSAQMLAKSAENAAIDDCIYFLDRALVRGSITSEVFLKEVRKLSKRQFMAKAHLIKIAQTRAAERR